MPQKNWDKYEVALLIEAYQNILMTSIWRISNGYMFEKRN